MNADRFSNSAQNNAEETLPGRGESGRRNFVPTNIRASRALPEMSFSTPARSFSCKNNSSFVVKTPAKGWPPPLGGLPGVPPRQELLSPSVLHLFGAAYICLPIRSSSSRMYALLAPLALIWRLNLALEPLKDGNLAPWLLEVPTSSWRFGIVLSPRDEYLAIP